MTVKTYSGSRVAREPIVISRSASRLGVITHVLTPQRSQAVWNHSPDGFEWGYGGSGPAQLALALLLDVLDDSALAVELHQDFKRAHVARWGDEWEITAAEIAQWALAAHSERPEREGGAA